MNNSRQNQSGAVLIVSLVVLLVLTIVVLSANRNVLLQERMTAAIRDSDIAFQAAESGLVEAEEFINDVLPGLGGVGIFSATGDNGLYAINAGPSDYTDPAVWADGVTRQAVATANGYDVRYFVESLGAFAIGGLGESIALNNDYSQPEQDTVADVFRVVVRAAGPNGTPVKVVASYFSANL